MTHQQWFARFSHIVLLLIGCAFVAIGCEKADTDSVEQQNYLLRAEQFDLETVVGLIRNGRATDASALQTIVNDRSSAINNVDVDSDGNVDMVMVRETETNGNKNFEFVAVPSSRPNDQPVQVATINFVRNGTNINLQAGYPTYVYGHHDHYYNTSLAYDLALFHWMYAPHPYYMPVYSSFHYSPFRVYAPGMLMSTRTTYRTTTQVSPIARASRPVSFTTASSMPSSYQRSTFRAPATTISSMRGTTRTYGVASPSVNSRQGTSFWSSRPSTTTSSPSYRPSFGGGGSSYSRPSYSSPSRSSFGGGGFRSGGSSFGGRRR